MILQNFRLPGNLRKPGDLYLVTKEDKISDLSVYPPLDNHDEVVDCEGGYLAPGLFDLQLYGAANLIFGETFLQENLLAIDRHHLKYGTTRYLLTVYSLKPEDIIQAIDAVRKFMNRPDTGCLGLHLEGPWLNETKRGAHRADIVHPPTIAEVENILNYGKDVIKLITLAPEICSADCFELLLNSGITLSIGHSEASHREAAGYFDQGIRMSTHLYNAMSGMHHRTPGLVGAILADNRVFTTIIADGIHVDYLAVGLAYRIKRNKLILISDTGFLDAAGDNHTLQGIPVHEKEGAFYTSQGNLAGSAIALIHAVQNVVRHVNISIPEAIRMASQLPAGVLGMEKYGHLAKGKVADILCLNEQLEIKKVIRNGKLC